jgi:hypothetical protein
MRSSTEAFEYSGVATRLPVQDLNRARAFYASKLGLEPIEERPGGLLYRCGAGCSRCLFPVVHLPGPTRKWDLRSRIYGPPSKCCVRVAWCLRSMTCRV